MANEASRVWLEGKSTSMARRKKQRSSTFGSVLRSLERLDAFETILDAPFNVIDDTKTESQ
eukprot:10990038-Prorocentrum_lima.AAC.1